MNVQLATKTNFVTSLTLICQNTDPSALFLSSLPSFCLCVCACEAVLSQAMLHRTSVCLISLYENERRPVC